MKRRFSCLVRLLLILVLWLSLAAQVQAESYGLKFACPAARHASLAEEIGRYFAALDIAPGLYRRTVATNEEALFFSLNSRPGDTTTLDFHERPEFAIPWHIDWVTTATGDLRNVLTVTEKEIALALMQRGRLTEFSGAACSVDALREHIGIRKNIVAWAERLEWGWPDGDASAWNFRYWQDGTPLPGLATWSAIQDSFFNQQAYSIGCYTAAKLIMTQGILDYYARVARQLDRVALVESRLLADGDPLVAVEPGEMWRFEPDAEVEALRRPGKILRVVTEVAPGNFVPGDWVHFFNADPESYRKIGYEGSNPIYLGRNRFADYYNDHDHHYSYVEKLDEVYQWRHGVFSRSRDAAKRVPLTPAELERLSRPPSEGGLLLPVRAVPYFFGAEPLP